MRPSCLLCDNFNFREQNLVILQRRVPGLSESAFTRFVARAKRAVHLTGDINVVVTNNTRLRRLNHRFLGKDRSTDVLSFPATRLRSNDFAGDIAISAEIAAQNARRLGHTTREEIQILTLHGILHLAGYDHENDQGRMAAKELHLRRELGLPVGLIERSEVSRNRRSKTRKNARKARRIKSPRASSTTTSP